MGPRSLDVLPELKKEPHNNPCRQHVKAKKQTHNNHSKTMIYRRHQENPPQYFKHMALVHKINKPVALKQEGVMYPYVFIMLNS